MKKVLVIGETIQDWYTYTTKKGVSAETPTIVGYMGTEEMHFGGAANVVKNLQALGCLTTFITNDRHLIKKHRFFVDGYKLLQIDTIPDFKITHSERSDLRNFVRQEIQNHDVVVVADYRHGLIDLELAKGIVSLCRKYSVPLFIDSQVSQSGSNHRWYRCKKPPQKVIYLLNEKELESLLGRNASLQDAQDLLGGEIILKRGAQGCDVLHYSKYKKVVTFDSPKVEAVDTTGAGDCFLAALVATGSYSKANQWAAASVTYKGTQTPKVEDAKALVGFSLD